MGEEDRAGGANTSTTIEMEKQTNGDRLSRVPWDEDKTWTILNR